MSESERGRGRGGGEIRGSERGRGGGNEREVGMKGTVRRVCLQEAGR